MDDLLDIAASNTSLKLSHESRRATTRFRKLNLRQTQFDPALAYDGAEIFRIPDLAVNVTGFAGNNRFHIDHLSL